MTNNELLLSISNLMDTKLNSLEKHMDEKMDAMEIRLNNKIDEVEIRLDCKIDVVEESLGGRIHRTNLILENQVLPRIKEIESCYLSTYERYKQGNTKIEQLQLDVSIIKDVLLEHTEKLKVYQQKFALA